jgi:iron complex transport system substrate-binding protein
MRMPFYLLVVALAGLACLAGCGSREPVPVAQVREPARIICATPALAEVVFALGAGERVVGVSDYTVWPPEAVEKPRIGGWMNPDRERLLALAPDLILTQGLHEPLVAFARRYDIWIEQIPTDSLQDVLMQFEVVGALLGDDSKGVALHAAITGELERLRAQVADLPPRRVALFLERPDGVMRGLTTIGSGTFLGSLLSIAGGVNVFADVVGDYPQVSREALLSRAPEVIIELHSGPVDQARQERILSDWQVLGSLPAVQQGNVLFLAGDHVLIPGPRVVETARRLVALLHPEVASW